MLAGGLTRQKRPYKKMPGWLKIISAVSAFFSAKKLSISTNPAAIRAHNDQILWPYPLAEELILKK